MTPTPDNTAEAYTDSQKLRLLAKWFDVQTSISLAKLPKGDQVQVQSDLNRIADEIEHRSIGERALKDKIRKEFDDMKTEEEKVKHLIDKIYKDSGDTNVVRKTKSGGWELRFITDYPMQHGGDQKSFIPKEIMDYMLKMESDNSEMLQDLIVRDIGERAKEEKDNDDSGIRDIIKAFGETLKSKEEEIAKLKEEIEDFRLSILRLQQEMIATYYNVEEVNKGILNNFIDKVSNTLIKEAAKKINPKEIWDSIEPKKY